MKKILTAINALLLVFLSACASEKTPQTETNSVGDITVYASFYPIYDFAQKIGGDKITVRSLVPTGVEPHEWEPSAADVALLSSASLLILNGANMESWADDIKVNKINLSDDVTLMEAEDGVDPHAWLDPSLAKIYAKTIADELSKLDTENKDYYQSNYDYYAEKFDGLDKAYRDKLSEIRVKAIITSHEAFGYLCAAYGVKQVSAEGVTPDSEPHPARIAEIIEYAKQNQINVIFYENGGSDKVARTIADAVGGEISALDTLEYLNDAEGDYFSVMESNLDALYEALR
ncbi:ABC transporter substrate-binding protein [Clostridia bacterium]|nr:ABC transporter substrate-binding protein [Clostridia bacterium]